MPLLADRTYKGVVAAGSRLIQSSKAGTPGFQVQIQYEGGEASYTIWITAKNRDRAEKDFFTLGVTREQLASRSYLVNHLPLAIQGVEISFGTKEEIFQGKTTVKVSWIGKVRANDESDLAREVASLFADASQDEAHQEQELSPEIDEFAESDEEDIPF